LVRGLSGQLYVLSFSICSDVGLQVQQSFYQFAYNYIQKFKQSIVLENYTFLRTINHRLLALKSVSHAQKSRQLEKKFILLKTTIIIWQQKLQIN